MIYALDTNIIIRYLRKETMVLKKYDLAVSSGNDLVIPKVVDYEIQRGFQIASAPSKEVAYMVMLSPDGCCKVVEMNAACWKRAERVYTELYCKHFTVGELDILIAAFCLVNGYTLVTNNTKDFENINGLQLIDWTKE